MIFTLKIVFVETHQTKSAACDDYMWTCVSQHIHRVSSSALPLPSQNVRPLLYRRQKKIVFPSFALSYPPPPETMRIGGLRYAPR